MNVPRTGRRNKTACMRAAVDLRGDGPLGVPVAGVAPPRPDCVYSRRVLVIRSLASPRAVAT